MTSDQANKDIAAQYRRLADAIEREGTGALPSAALVDATPAPVEVVSPILAEFTHRRVVCSEAEFDGLAARDPATAYLVLPDGAIAAIRDAAGEAA